MSAASERNHVIDFLTENAIQLLVADRLKAPRDEEREPLTKEKAAGYMIDVTTMLSAAYIMVNNETKSP